MGRFGGVTNPQESGNCMAGRYEVIGANELVVHGNDDLDDLLGAYELIGARGRPSTARQSMARGRAGGGGGASLAQQIVNRNSVAVREREPTKTRRQYIPMNSTGTVAAAASAVLNTQPQALAFRPERIVVPATIAPDFTIDSIFCGIKPQFVATGSVSAETFTQDARDCEMHMDTVTTSQNFTLNITNQSGAARQFRATVFGSMVDD